MPCGAEGRVSTACCLRLRILESRSALMKYLLVLLLTVFCSAAAAAAGDSLATRNAATLARGALLPTPEGAAFDAPGTQFWRLNWDWTSEFFRSQIGNERILIDGETHRLALRGQGTAASGLAWSVELPWLHQGGGVLDSSIDGWHDFFGLSNGGRDEYAQDQYRFVLDHSGRRLLDIDHGGSGIGDVLLGLGWSPVDGTAVRATAQIGTGDADSLRGGRHGLALQVDRHWALTALPGLSGSLMLGGSWTDTAGPLQQLQRRWAGFGSASAAWKFQPKTSFIVQLQANSPLYRDSDLEPLERPGMQLSLALRLRLSGGRRLDLGFQEDPITGSSPDFSLFTAYRWR